ncbi:peptidoglycan-binding protein [Kitasatospora purpeofusca]|uniref:Peptidoglycan-binding protein n=1 Tax=Kitasatospora purpeofusca TaxID=67352 RepID=A0ABZ1U044_9ACTN|nr:peptidoglycan-binding protein [Kitasatospora purpeofusca]
MATALGAALVSVGAVAGSSFVRSPAQAAADSRPPQASTVTAPVTSQVLRSTVVLRGTFSEGKKISVTPTSVAATAGNPGGANAVVTRLLAKPDDEVKPGIPLVEYSGRPVFALEGPLPFYRDLTPGESGADVEQLQTALGKLGHDVGSDTPGTFGPGTKRALTALYTAMGYQVPITGATTAAAVKAARQEADQARAALKEGQKPAPSTTTASAPSPGATPDASGGAGPAKAPDPTRSAGPGGGAARAPDLAALRQRVTQAEEAVRQAESIDGPMLPASECVYLPSRPTRVATLPLEVGDPVKGPVITLARGDMQLVGMLDPARAALVQPGMPAQVLSETQGREAKATVASLGELMAPGDVPPAAKGGEPTGPPPQAVNGGAAYLPLAISPAEPWDKAWAGREVRIIITSATTSGPVLTVPEAAVFAGADTRTHVTTVRQDGTRQLVNVTTGPSADGMVQVTAVDGGHLAPGDQVVIGE